MEERSGREKVEERGGREEVEGRGGREKRRGTVEGREWKEEPRERQQRIVEFPVQQCAPERFLS